MARLRITLLLDENETEAQFSIRTSADPENAIVLTESINQVFIPADSVQIIPPDAERPAFERHPA